MKAGVWIDTICVTQSQRALISRRARGWIVSQDLAMRDTGLAMTRLQRQRDEFAILPKFELKAAFKPL